MPGLEPTSISLVDVMYEGRVKLDMDEMLDEWGREFLAESRRRTDLIRFGRFQEAWWDKKADADTHYELFPLSQDLHAALSFHYGAFAKVDGDCGSRSHIGRINMYGFIPISHVNFLDYE